MGTPFTTGAIIVAAGHGTRMGGMDRVDKCALPLSGRSLLYYSVAAFARVVDVVVVAVAPDRLAAWGATVGAETWPLVATMVAGGETRQDSVRAGFDALKRARAVDVVAIHDGARPLVMAETIRRCIDRAWADGAAITAVPVTDTIKRVEGEQIVATLDRTTLWAAQTPQAFRADLLQSAYTWADSVARAAFTDEAGMVEAFGRLVAVVRGDRSNIKVTEPADLAIAEALLAARGGARDA
jgi:2-C-methyl-D-erythritol 4-phosphate cytidylyltransferase